MTCIHETPLSLIELVVLGSESAVKLETIPPTLKKMGLDLFDAMLKEKASLYEMALAIAILTAMETKESTAWPVVATTPNVLAQMLMRPLQIQLGGWGTKPIPLLPKGMQAVVDEGKVTWDPFILARVAKDGSTPKVIWDQWLRIAQTLKNAAPEASREARNTALKWAEKIRQQNQERESTSAKTPRRGGEAAS